MASTPRKHDFSEFQQVRINDETTLKKLNN